jgi:hypothetical protein
MALTLWTTFALVVWLVLWSLGTKGLDAAMLALLIVIIGATLNILKRYIPTRGS